MPSKLAAVKAALEVAGLKIVRVEDDSELKWIWGSHDNHYVSVHVVLTGDPGAVFSGNLQPDVINPGNGYSPFQIRFTEKVGVERQTIIADYPEEVAGDGRFVNGVLAKEMEIERVIWVVFHANLSFARGERRYEDLPK